MGKGNWEEFSISLLVILIFPLIPVGMELILNKNCLDSTLLLTTAMYSITVFTSSKYKFFSIAAILPGGFFSAMYANLLKDERLSMIAKESAIESHSFYVILLSSITMLAIATIHIAERYKRHVMEGEQFLTFYNK